LTKKICEAIEKFPKISGLNGISSNNLFNCFDKLPINEGKIYEYIKPNDIISFDLNFTEYWLEVDMVMSCDDKSFNITFELKVDCNSYISNLKNILIKMGITTWAQYVQEHGEHIPDYYIYSSFTFDFLKDLKQNPNNNNNSKPRSNFSTGISSTNIKNIELDNYHGKNSQK
jgi:hypothetical protein